MRELAIIFAINVGVWSSLFLLIRKLSQLPVRQVARRSVEIASRYTSKSNQTAHLLVSLFALFVLVYFLITGTDETLERLIIVPSSMLFLCSYFYWLGGKNTGGKEK